MNMKKLLLVAFLSIFLFTSSPVYAVTQAELNQQFIALLQKMITLILQKIQVLQAQLAEIQARELTTSSIVPLLPTSTPAPAPQPAPVQEPGTVNVVEIDGGRHVILPPGQTTIEVPQPKVWCKYAVRYLPQLHPGFTYDSKGGQGWYFDTWDRAKSGVEVDGIFQKGHDCKGI